MPPTDKMHICGYVMGEDWWLLAGHPLATWLPILAMIKSTYQYTGLPMAGHLCDINIVVSLVKQSEVVFISLSTAVGKVLETSANLFNRPQMIIWLGVDVFFYWIMVISHSGHQCGNQQGLLGLPVYMYGRGKNWCNCGFYLPFCVVQLIIEPAMNNISLFPLLL